MGIVVIIALFASMVFSFLGISRPMMRLNGALGEMAGGNLDVVIPGARRGDEIGDLAKTVTVIRENAEQKARDEAEAKIKQDQIAAQQRKADMIKLADTFETAVGEIVETVSSASTELEASAGTLTSNAERAQELTTMVAAASEEASTNVQSVASATEELSSSVNEISRQVQESARMATEAVDQARTTNDRVSQLSKAASRIGDVVELINTIAEQTNLLALNATIEAARAGDAGRGFAVVASEVKALAEQTSKATGEIGQQITGIQAATQDSVNAIKEISGTIEKLSEISSTIAAAVEEQGAATQEISRNVQQAAHGTQQVSSNITDVQRGASETGSASTQVLSAAQSLSGDSNRLKQEVGKFLDGSRGQPPAGPHQIVGLGDLAVPRFARHDDHPAAEALDQGGVVGPVGSLGVGSSQYAGAERLRCLHGDERAAVGGGDDQARGVDRLDRGHGDRRHGTVGAGVNGIDDGHEQIRRRQRSGGVMDADDRRLVGDRREAGPHRHAARGSSGDGVLARVAHPRPARPRRRQRSPSAPRRRRRQRDDPSGSYCLAAPNRVPPPPPTTTVHTVSTLL